MCRHLSSEPKESLLPHFFLLFHRPHVYVYGWIVPAIYIPLFCAKLYRNVQSNAKDRRCGRFPLKHAVGWILAKIVWGMNLVQKKYIWVNARCPLLLQLWVPAVSDQKLGYTARWFPFLTLHLYSYSYLVSIMVVNMYHDVSCLLRFCRRWTHCDWYLSIWVGSTTTSFSNLKWHDTFFAGPELLVRLVKQFLFVCLEIWYVHGYVFTRDMFLMMFIVYVYLYACVCVNMFLFICVNIYIYITWLDWIVMSRIQRVKGIRKELSTTIVR